MQKFIIGNTNKEDFNGYISSINEDGSFVLNVWSIIVMEIIHVSAECYPVAKAGGLGDVVGALPKYQAKQGHTTKVVMPMYRTKFLYENEW